MEQEKKIFSPILRSYNGDLTKRWRIEWKVHNPKGKLIRCAKPIYITGDTVEQRIKNAKKIIFDLEISKFDKIPDKNIFDLVFEYKFTWKPKTISTYRTVINVYLIWCGNTKPEKIKEKDFPNFLTYLKNKEYSNNNISKFRVIIYSFYEIAKDLKLTKINPVTKETAIKKNPTSLMYFSKIQINKIISYPGLNPQLKLAIQFLFYCFIRPGEQREMKISWINFDLQFIEIPAEHSKNGKTQKVVIPDAFIDDIIYLNKYPNNYYVLSKIGAPGLDKLATNWINNQHSKVLDSLKIRGNYAFYSWKHTGAVMAVQSGINLKDLQLQLRHHSLDMVNEYLKNLGVTDSDNLKTRFPTI